MLQTCRGGVHGTLPHLPVRFSNFPWICRVSYPRAGRGKRRQRRWWRGGERRRRRGSVTAAAAAAAAEVLPASSAEEAFYHSSSPPSLFRSSPHPTSGEPEGYRQRAKHSGFMHICTYTLCLAALLKGLPHLSSSVTLLFPHFPNFHVLSSPSRPLVNP